MVNDNAWYVTAGDPLGEFYISPPFDDMDDAMAWGDANVPLELDYNCTRARPGPLNPTRGSMVERSPDKRQT